MVLVINESALSKNLKGYFLNKGILSLPFQFQEITCVHKNVQDLENHLDHSNYLNVPKTQHKETQDY